MLVIGSFHPKQFSCNFFFVNIQDKLSPHGCFHCATEEYVTVLSIAAWPEHHHGYVHDQSKTSVLALLSSSELATWWALNDLISFHPGISIRHYRAHTLGIFGYPDIALRARTNSSHTATYTVLKSAYCVDFTSSLQQQLFIPLQVWVESWPFTSEFPLVTQVSCFASVERESWCLDHFGSSTRDSVTGSLSDRHLFMNMHFPRYSP